MQNEIISECTIPSRDGLIENPGWAREPVIRYCRENIKAGALKIKEWDYYLFNNGRYGVAFTISDLGYIGMLSVSFIDLVNAVEHTESEITLFPKGKKFGLGRSTEDASGEAHTKRLDLVFSNRGLGRHISCRFKRFDKDLDFNAEFDIIEPDMEAMYIVTPWKEKQTAFYYNCKRNCLTAQGTVEYGKNRFEFSSTDTAGVLDWGRGVWTYDNTWFWGTGSGRVGSELFGFNLGYGFSDRSSASENAVFYRGRIHKLSEVTFNIPAGADGKREFMKPWTITSDDDRFNGSFIPIIDRNACLDFKLIVSDQHQVFGKMTGTAVLDDGSTVEFKDFICALEVVHNRY